MRRLELTKGDKINELVYVCEAPEFSKPQRRKCIFRCTCGNEFVTALSLARNGQTKSCGCLIKHTTHGDASSDHKKRDYYYKLLYRMKARCYNPNNNRYYTYGARGIKICDEWINDHLSLKRWIIDNLGERPDNMTLDRINNDGNYEPGNLRWATMSTQMNNRTI